MRKCHFQPKFRQTHIVLVAQMQECQIASCRALFLLAESAQSQGQLSKRCHLSQLCLLALSRDGLGVKCQHVVEKKCLKFWEKSLMLRVVKKISEKGNLP